ncbi:DUF4190 domain-containing protein [Haloechinothrix halophila]|uniref:DUF4190 domain-containing protein n=1 Tax=Haloechinothrix halophila TaxID=1069073 RepID=UPI00040B42A9|nr:DUF4190 domain-containing protein [Haloechinothrix halophila]
MPPDRGTNGLAVAALVLGIVGFLPPSPLVGLVLGIIALTQVKRRHERGKGMAVAGVVLSSLWIVLFVIVIIAGILDDVERTPTGEVTAEDTVPLENLRIGDCVEKVTEDRNYFSVTVMPCDEPHHSEVFAKFDLRGEAWPGEETVFADANAGCSDALREYSSTAYDDIDVAIFTFHPTAFTWADGDREIICLTDYEDGPRTGSIEGT